MFVFLVFVNEIGVLFYFIIFKFNIVMLFIFDVL